MKKQTTWRAKRTWG